MKTGIIGVNNFTLDLASRAVNSGYEVLISHARDNNILKQTVQKMGEKVQLATKQEAASADIILLFIPRENLEAWLNDLPDMTDKIILHINNSIFNIQTFLPDFETKSATEIITDHLPNTHVVKIFNSLEPMLILPERKNQDRNEIFYEGINEDVKNEVKVFLEALQFSAVDLTGQCMLSNLKVSA
ncbi:NAD(P)-binding domain-containing protein [Flavobacterium aquidurense]|uniref:NADPH-dependent F420 reductase n=1 Tax=Flavobacterium aquidurense TaxID=362413 RepID=UPI0028611980|nr:NAD(P)-binding domain-containing protein [Flavobacterium aquidurense]MDR7370187.1 putative dinucleotide-binding enzyme [Flavobacterium aquidurense]